MKLVNVVLIPLSVALLTLVAGCGEEAAEQQEVLRPVRYQEALALGDARVRTFSGTAQAGEESQLSFKVNGNIERLEVGVGDQVRRGDAIAILDDNDYRLRVQEAEAALSKAQAEFRNAEATYARVQALWENANASEQDLDGAEAAYESAAAQVRSVEKRLELARLQVEYCRLSAPFAGAVASVEIELNENVRAGQAVVVLSSAGRPEVKVAVPEVIIAQIRTGSPVTVTFDALQGRDLTATVTEVGVASTGFATTFPVTVRLDDDEPAVRPGMAARVAFRLEATGARGVVVPAVAVGEDTRGRFVFVVERSAAGVGVTRRRDVEVGDLVSEGLEILAGLREGELVVTAGVSRITDGQRVKLD